MTNVTRGGRVRLHLKLPGPGIGSTCVEGEFLTFDADFDCWYIYWEAEQRKVAIFVDWICRVEWLSSID